MVGILILLFGAIPEIGLNSLLRVGDELMKPRNLIIVSMILVVGIGGMVVPLGGNASCCGRTRHQTGDHPKPLQRSFCDWSTHRRPQSIRGADRDVTVGGNGGKGGAGDL